MIYWLVLFITTTATTCSAFGQQPAKTDYGMPDQIDEKSGKNQQENWIDFSHADPPSWGTGEGTKHHFKVILPKEHREDMPMLVILHSVGGVELGDRHQTWSMYHGLNEWGYQLVLSQTRGGKAGWWGQAEIDKDPDSYVSQHAADEKRILSTVDWVAARYGIDRARIYLSGVSMGGSGVLGNGMGRGDIFAAVQAIIPAGHLHFDVRTKDLGKHDTPPLIYLYSHRDVWAREHAAVRKNIHDRGIGLFAAWGPMGHAYYRPFFHESTLGMPWLEIRRDEAYPVFTNASTDDAYQTPENSKDLAPIGQCNGYFRWRVIEDSQKRFEIELWLVSSEQLAESSKTFDKQLENYRESLVMKLKNNPEHGPAIHQLKLLDPYIEFRDGRGVATPPEESEVDLMLRRVQHFQPDQTGRVRWQLTRDGVDRAGGEMQLKPADPLVFRRLILTAEPARLVIERSGAVE